VRSGRPQRFVELRSEEEVRGEQSGPAERTAMARAGRGFEGDHAPENAEGGAGEPEQAEGPLALDEPGRHAHRQAAGGNDEAGDDRHVRQLSPAGQQLRGSRADLADRARRAPGGEGDLDGGSGSLDRVG